MRSTLRIVQPTTIPDEGTRIEINGSDVTDSIAAVDLKMRPGRPTTVSLDLMLHGLDGIEVDAADVVLPDKTRAELVALGWAPPTSVLREVVEERRRQTAKHGDQGHLPDGTAPHLVLDALPAYLGAARADNLAEWAKARTKAASQNEGGDGSITFEHVLTEEWAEAIAESDPVKLRAELVQVAAVAVQWAEAIDRRSQQEAPR